MRPTQITAESEAYKTLEEVNAYYFAYADNHELFKGAWEAAKRQRNA